MGEAIRCAWCHRPLLDEQNARTHILVCGKNPSAARIRELEAEVARLTAEARRFYLADGSYIELDPAEVIERRKAAARENTRLREAVRAFIATDDSPVWTITGGGEVSHYCVSCNRNERTGEHEAECEVGALFALLDEPPPASAALLAHPPPEPKP